MNEGQLQEWEKELRRRERDRRRQIFKQEFGCLLVPLVVAVGLAARWRLR